MKFSDIGHLHCSWCQNLAIIYIGELEENLLRKCILATFTLGEIHTVDYIFPFKYGLNH